MSNKVFIANSWLQDHLKDESETIRDTNGQKDSDIDSYNVPLVDPHGQAAADHSEIPPIPEAFLPEKYFIPGWTGNSLFSRPAVAVKKLQEELWRDALATFKSSSSLPKTLSTAIHKEFLSVAPKIYQIMERKADYKEEIERLKNDSYFWAQFSREDSPVEDILDCFSELYCFRVATIYLLKLKFLVSFSDAINFEYGRNHILNPSSFINQLFKKGSSGEINCESLKMNHYSWYRPSSKIAENVDTLTRSFADITVTQLMKICSFREQRKESSVMNTKLNFSEEGYSHALSHQSFGRFINQLLVFFPLWSSQERFSYPRSEFVNCPEVLNTKFVGDHIESLGQGHWLAQEKNMNLNWSEMICPDFATLEPGSEIFVKTSQELQFLNFLVYYSKYSKDSHINTRDFICRVTKDKYNKTKQNQSKQISLFTSREQQVDLVYNRVVLNLAHLPKKNPHHYLIGQIQAQSDILATEGQLLVMTNQKLFVPSQSKKVETLLKDFKIEAIFNFEKLKGRGEVSNFIYILSKRNPFARPKNYLDIDPHTLSDHKGPRQESCLSFRWNGELTLFSKFENIVEELYTFFMERPSSGTSIYQRGLDHDLSFEFHQDAIIEGKLLSSLTSDNDNITHPQFFKNLTRSCSPFDKFFSFHELQITEQAPRTSDFLGIPRTEHNRYSSVLVIDLRDSLRPQLEIISPESYPAKREEYGNAYFQYYGLTPKIKNINLNLLREYLSTDLGKQIIQLCLSGGPTKMKGKLKSLLLPNFFMDGVDLSTINPEKFLFFNLSEEELLNFHPEHLPGIISSELQNIERLQEENPWLYLSLLGHFKLTINAALEKVNAGPSSKDLNFTNPLLVEALTSLETFTIYPNEEVYTELLIAHKGELESPLAGMKFHEQGDECYLAIFGQEKLLIKFHAERETLLFIQFILSKAIGMPTLTILQNLQIPKHDELKQVLTQFNQVKSQLHDLYRDIKGILKSSLTKQIAQV